MEPEFWHRRWAEGRLGFHQEKVNSRLRRLWDELAADGGDDDDGGATVLVPLCGKSLDMLWLAERGWRVVGVEINERGCRDFYADNRLDYTRRKAGRFIRLQGGGVEIWCGDFFALTAGADADADANAICARYAYDRAALIALPAPMRARYAAHLASLLAAGGGVLLISMDYDERKMNGPPFSVPEAQVRELFADMFSVEVVAESSGPDIVGNLAKRGLDTLRETVYWMRRR